MIPKQFDLPNARFIKIKSKSKEAVENNWQDKNNYSYEEACKLVEEGWNIGIINASCNLLVIDCDSKEIEELIVKSDLPKTFVVNTSRPEKKHIYYRCKDMTKSKVYFKDNLGDIRFNGSSFYTLIPPSTHPNGIQYRIKIDTDIVEVDENTVLETFKEYIKKPKKRKTTLDGVGKGERDDTLFQTACKLRTTGLPYDDALIVLREKNKNNKPPVDENQLIKCLNSAYGYTDEERKIDGVIDKRLLFQDIVYDEQHKYKVLFVEKNKDDYIYMLDAINKREVPENVWLFPTWKEKIEKINMTRIYNDIYNLLKDIIVFPDEIYYKLYTLWLISTWKIEYFHHIGFFMFLGMIDSAKTLALDLARELGCKAIQSSEITFPALVRASHFYNCTILIDEIQDRFNNNNDKGIEFKNYIKPSYRRGNMYIVADLKDQKRMITYNNFGFKAMAGEYCNERAIKTRSIIVEMEQAKPKIKDISKLIDDNRFAKIRDKLLIYRYTTGEPPHLPDKLNNIELYGRKREIYTPILRIALELKLDTEDIMNYMMKEKKEQEDEIKESLEYQILEEIWRMMHMQSLDTFDKIGYSDIREIIFQDLQYNDLKIIRDNAQKLGYCISKKLLLSTRKIDGKTYINMESEKTKKRLKYLFKRFGFENEDDDKNNEKSDGL